MQQNSFFLIAGPCVIEDAESPYFIANELKNICERLNIKLYFKASYKKANRTKIDSFTGLETNEALEILKDIKNKFSLNIVTDVHESIDCEKVAEFADILQIPAFLCRQTDLLLAAGRTGKIVNIKKGQFMSPEAMQHSVEKVYSTQNQQVWLTERGTTFGYNDLIVDFTAVPRMKKIGVPVIVDCTHSVQKPNQTIGVTGGDPEMIETLALAAIATGADGLFIETHQNPKIAKSDAASMLQLDKLENILKKCLAVRKALS